MARKSKAFRKRSAASKKGWETRRKKNPQQWGRKAVTKRQESRKELQKQLRKLKRENEKLQSLLHEAEERAAIQEELQRRVMGETERFVSISNLPKQELGESPDAYMQRLVNMLRLFYDVEGAYMDVAAQTGLHPREVYSYWMSPGIEWVA